MLDDPNEIFMRIDQLVDSAKWDVLKLLCEQQLADCEASSDPDFAARLHRALATANDFLGNQVEAITSYRVCVAHWPTSELMSAALFHVLLSVNRTSEALAEALSHLQSRQRLGKSSKYYREVFDELEPGGFSSKDLPLFESCKQMLKTLE